MTTKEKIKVMQHFDNNGAIVINGDTVYQKSIDGEVIWAWDKQKFEIYEEPKEVELLYEWWFKINMNSKPTISIYISTNKDADISFRSHYSYGKTGRYFNPETEEFGIVK